MNQMLFHLAFPVSNIAQTKSFYVEGLGCGIGRETSNSLILNLYGHQIVAHITQELLNPQKSVYPRHFGVIFTSEIDWKLLLKRAQQKHLCFYQQSKRRFVDSPLEHRTFFLEDPFHNLLEFKFYCYPEAVFGNVDYAQIGDPTEV